MERQTYTNTNRYLFLFLIALMVSCSKNDIQIAKSLNKEITIYPDYKDVTIPVNIAPLNFSIADSRDRKSTRLNSSHPNPSRMPSSA